jgi:hypothetical protein
MEEEVWTALDADKVPGPDQVQQCHRCIIPGDENMLSIVHCFPGMGVGEGIRPASGIRSLFKNRDRKSSACKKNAGGQTAEACAGYDNRLQ